MTFDASVNLGQLLTLISILGSGLVVVVTMRADMRAIVARVANIEKAVERQTDILVQINRQEVRMDSQEKRIERLEASAA